MSSYTQLLYQIVFSTKWREKTISDDGAEMLYRFIWGVLKEKNCILYQIGGVEDHLHIVTHIHQSVAVADLVKDIKLSSRAFIKERGILPLFRGWQDGYGAFSYSIHSKEKLVTYVKNQREHHNTQSFVDEYKALLEEHKVDFEEKYLL